MKKRNFVSLTIAFSFLAISSTGLCLYLGLKSEVIETVHVLFGLIFTATAVFHIWYNFASLRNYSLNRKIHGIRRELLIAFSCCAALLAVICTGSSIMDDLSHAGRYLSGNGKKHQEPEEGIIFSEISTNEKVKGTSLSLLIREKKEVIAPIIAIWTEDSASGQPNGKLFVPAKKADIPPSLTNTQQHDNSRGRKQFPTSALNTALLPEFTRHNQDHVSNYGQVTPLNNFILATNASVTGPFTVFLEIRYGEKTELYRAVIDPAKSNVFILQDAHTSSNMPSSSKNALIVEGIVEIM